MSFFFPKIKTKQDKFSFSFFAYLLCLKIIEEINEKFILYLSIFTNLLIFMFYFILCWNVKRKRRM